MAYYDQHFYRRTIAVQVSLSILSTISVLLRYLARRKRKAQLKGDDLWAFLSMLLYWVYIGFGFYGLFLLIAINAMMRPSDLGWNRFTQWRRPPTHCCTTICIRTCPQGKDRRPRPSVHDLNLTRSIGIIRCGIALIIHLHRGENQRAIALPKDLPYRQMVSNC